MTKQKWIVLSVATPVILALVGLGFAAMSTNPPFTVPFWLPTLFFALAGMVTLILVIFLIWPMINRMREKFACRDAGWWTTLADGDRKDIKHRVPLRDVRADIETVKKTGYCCVHFVFVFINATVYKVNIRQVDGDIYADGMKLPDKLTINMKHEELMFSHGIGFGLRCSVLIREPYLQELIKLSGKTVRFGLERTNIMADLIDPTGEKADEFKLEIPHRVIVDVPDLTIDHQPVPCRVDLLRE